MVKRAWDHIVLSHIRWRGQLRCVVVCVGHWFVCQLFVIYLVSPYCSNSLSHSWPAFSLWALDVFIVMSSCFLVSLSPLPLLSPLLSLPLALWWKWYDGSIEFYAVLIFLFLFSPLSPSTLSPSLSLSVEVAMIGVISPCLIQGQHHLQRIIV